LDLLDTSLVWKTQIQAPSPQATAVLHAIARHAQVDEASQWAGRLAAETWLLPTQPPKLFGSTPFRQKLADRSTRINCDYCRRSNMFLRDLVASQRGRQR
jgi:hypothetical protein